MSGSTIKRISQETFDETVRENMEEFDMSREEAVKDAIKQFTSQGVDLSTICISYGECDDHWLDQLRSQVEVIQAVASERAKPEDAARYEMSQVMTALQAMATACEDGNAVRAGNAKKLLGGQSMHNIISNLLARDDRALVLASLVAIKAICQGDENNRDSFFLGSMSKLCACANTYLSDTTILKEALSAVKVLCTKTEDSKVNFVRYGGLDLLIQVMEKYPEDIGVVDEVCQALRVVTAVDDLRKDFNSAHNHTRTLVMKGAIPLLIGCTKTFRGNLNVMVSGLAALRNMANNEDSVNQIVQLGGLELTVGALREHIDNATLVRAAISVMRNVSADDQHKSVLCTQGGAELILKGMRKHHDDSKVQEHGLASLAAMALRSPENASNIASLGGITTILKAMQSHPTATSVQRQGCLAVRNLVSRNPELVEFLLDSGAEPILRQAGKYQESVDEAYAALRDLRCEVKRMVVDATTGQMKDAVEEFGSAKTNFNPVFESSNELEASIDKAITTPQSSYRF